MLGIVHASIGAFIAGRELVPDMTDAARVARVSVECQSEFFERELAAHHRTPAPAGHASCCAGCGAPHEPGTSTCSYCRRAK